jgi:hypothetical protein
VFEFICLVSFENLQSFFLFTHPFLFFASAQSIQRSPVNSLNPACLLSRAAHAQPTFGQSRPVPPPLSVSPTQFHSLVQSQFLFPVGPLGSSPSSGPHRAGIRPRRPRLRVGRAPAPPPVGPRAEAGLRPWPFPTHFAPNRNTLATAAAAVDSPRPPSLLRRGVV